MQNIQQIGSQLYHCDPQGLVQVVGRANQWCARNMDTPAEEHVTFVAGTYQEARALARENFGTGNVVVWRAGE